LKDSVGKAAAKGKGAKKPAKAKGA